MSQWCAQWKVGVWAYCLMPNHVHLIVVPESEEGLRHAVGEAHRRDTRRINCREGWVAVEEVLPRWGKNRTMAVAAYQRVVREGLREGHRADLDAVVEQRVVDRESLRVVEIQWAEVNEAVCAQFDISVAAVLYRGRGRRKARIKRVMAWVGREVGGFPNQEMARRWGEILQC